MNEPAALRYATRRLRRAATRLLAHEAGRDPPTADALAAASGRLFERLSDHLARVIGPVGVQAIFLRAVKLLKAKFAFLDEHIVPRERGDSLGESLRQCLREQKPEVIQEVSVILFATFAGLLVTVIGDTLSWSFLQQIWPGTLLPEGESQEAEE